MGIRNLFKRQVSFTCMSRITRASIAIAGIDGVRKQVIKGIESDLKRIIKKHPEATIEELMQDDIVQKALNTPDYVALLKDVGMGEAHIRLLAQEALDRRK